MKTLVTYASRHGSTREIAEFIAAEIASQGHEVEVRAIAEVNSIDGYGAVVLGSAIYIGQWQKEAVEFIDRHIEVLNRVPVWLFSSGPIGEDPFPKEEPPATADLVEKTGAVGYRSFAGRLDRSRLGVGERLVARVVRAPEGDFRDWESIREWARSVASRLTSDVPVSS